MRKIDVLCFGGEDWWYHNRGHIDMQLMRRFARLGTLLYVNSIVMQKPKLSQGKRFVEKSVRKAKSIITGLLKNDAGFWVYSPFSLPAHHISCLRLINNIILREQISLIVRNLGMHDPIVWVACPAACDVAIKMEKTKLVYQRTDRFEEYPNVDADIISQYDRTLKRAADLTIYVNRKLFNQEAKQCKKTIFLDHGVDFRMFSTAENCKDVPQDIKDIKRPIVGFFGGIDDHTFDIQFVKQLVALLPEMNFVFVGNSSLDCADLLSKKNVTMVGQKPYEQIPCYGKCFDVAIMPWRQNRWIETCNPVKLKEYLALGKPVVSTPFAELQKYQDVVYEAKTPEDFADCIKRAYSEDNAELIAKRRQRVAQASWSSKAELVLRELFAQEKSDPRMLAGK